MIQTHEELMAALANDVFNKRQRLIMASQQYLTVIDDNTARALEVEYKAAETAYRDAKAAFARAMKADKRAD